MTTPHSKFMLRYLLPLVGCKVVGIKEKDEGFVTIVFAGLGKVYECELSKDEEGNGPGFLSGLPRPEPEVKPKTKLEASQRFAELDDGKVEQKAQKQAVQVQATPVQSTPWVRFEYVGGTSNKFWEVRTDGTTLTTRWGRIGTPGSLTNKVYGSPAAAESERDKLIRSKLVKGYKKKG